MTVRLSLTPLLLAAVALPGAAPAEDWPQFRGPRGDGVSSAAGLPAEWSPTLNVRWKVRTPGRGRSSPVVLGDRIWMTAADETPASPEEVALRLADLPEPGQLYVARRVSLRALCLDRVSGKLLYDVELFGVENPDPIHRLNGYATPTPAVEPGRVYCDFGTYGTACIDAATGRVVWKTRLPAEHVLGPGSSPVLVKDLLVLVRDGCDAQYVAALDKGTGKVLWRTDRPPMQTETRYEKKAYSTPLVVEAGGRVQIVAPGAQWVCSYDPADGREIWRVRHGRGFSLAPSAVYGHGMVYVATGCNVAELWAIRVDGGGDVTRTHVAWRAKGQIPLMSSPVLAGKELYCVSDDGIVSCFDAAGGKVHWRERIGGNHLASPLYADGKLYFFNWEGRTTVLKPGTEFVRLADNPLEGPLAATPAVAGRAIFLRTDAHLYCVEKQ